MSAPARAGAAGRGGPVFVRRDLGVALGLFLGAFGLYALPSLGNAFLYDDHEVIFGAPAPRSVGELLAVFGEPHFRGLPYYRPVVRATLLGQRMLHGEAPEPFHAANAALAGTAAALAFGLLRLPAFGVGRVPAALAAALFVAHPLASSAVLPIASGRETLLPAVLALLSTLGFLHGGRAARALAVVSFTGALFGKEASVVLPALFAAADALGLTPDPPGRSPARLAARYAPYAVVLLVYAAIRATLFAGGELALALLEEPAGPAASAAYALQTAWAPETALAYEPELAVWWSFPRLAWGLAATLGLVLVATRSGPSARRRALWWGTWLALSLLPTANVLRQEAPFDERYVFVGWLAFPAVAAIVLESGAVTTRMRRAALLAGAVALALACVTSAGRAATFRDDATFAAQWLRTNPSSPEAHHVLGLLALRDGRYAEAIAPLRAAVRLAPDSAELRHNLGVALLGDGKTAGARLELEAALRLAPDHPEAHNALGMVAVREGRAGEAEAHYRAALAARPGLVEARNNLATVLARRGDVAGAEAELRRALALAPDYADAHRNLALLLAGQGREEEARAHRRAAEAASSGTLR